MSRQPTGTGYQLIANERGQVAESDIEAAFRKEGLSPYSWSNGPGDVYSAHSHDYHKVLYCVAGSIAFAIGGDRVVLGPGDRLEIEPGTLHSAEVGNEGVTCMEAPRR